MNVDTSAWVGDKLYREATAQNLIHFLEGHYGLLKAKETNTLTLNVKAGWGFGKTFFLKGLAETLKKKHPVVYFDAWQTDFSEDPLVALVSELLAALSQPDNSSALSQKLNNLKSNTQGLIKFTYSVAAYVATFKGIDLPNIDPVLALKTEQVLDDHQKRKKAITDFKQALTELINEVTFKSEHDNESPQSNNPSPIAPPLFIIIDELDRCRPTYAIQLLESVKHIFGVKGLYFIFGTNLDELAHSVKAVYGQSFGAEAYLKRFFDFEFLLPEPDPIGYTQMLFERYGLNSFKYYSPIEILKPDITSAQFLFSEMMQAFGMSLRCQDQIAGTLQVVLLGANHSVRNERVHLTYLLLLLITKHSASTLFQAICQRRSEPYIATELQSKIKHAKFFNVENLEINIAELCLLYIGFASKSFKEINQTFTNRSGSDLNNLSDILINHIVVDQYAKQESLSTGSRRSSLFLHQYRDYVLEAGQLVQPLEFTQPDES